MTDKGDTQILLLQQKLDNHIEEYKLNRVEETERWGYLIDAQELNTKSIKELTDSTLDLVLVWKAADGTMKTMSAVGKFVKWLSGFAVIGVAIKWTFDHFK